LGGKIYKINLLDMTQTDKNDLSKTWSISLGFPSGVNGGATSESGPEGVSQSESIAIQNVSIR
jgi:hypothetical protein